MTACEKVILGLILLWALSHLVLKWGREAAIPATIIKVAESLVTT